MGGESKVAAIVSVVAVREWEGVAKELVELVDD